MNLERKTMDSIQSHLITEMATIQAWILDPETDYPVEMARHDLCELVDLYYENR